MKANQIEAWALRVIQQVEAGQPNEDSKVELKSDWPDHPAKAARRIAGHANAARGEPILWLIGVDQNSGVAGASNIEPADWYAQVKSWFNELAPNMTDINIPIRDRVIVALLFETDRSPFVVRNSDHGVQKGEWVEREIPWREGTAIRSATRYEVLKILAPLQKLPSVEVLAGWLELRTVGNIVWVGSNPNGGRHPRARQEGEGLTWSLHLELYVVPTTEQQVVIPHHKCDGAFEIIEALSRTSFNTISPTPPYSWIGDTPINQSSTIDGTPTEVIIRGPGVIYLDATTRTEDLQIGLEKNAQVDMRLTPAGANEPIIISERLLYVPSKKDRWIRWQIESSPTC